MNGSLVKEFYGKRENKESNSRFPFHFYVAGGEEEYGTENNLVKANIAKNGIKMRFVR